MYISPISPARALPTAISFSSARLALVCSVSTEISGRKKDRCQLRGSGAITTAAIRRDGWKEGCKQQTRPTEPGSSSVQVDSQRTFGGPFGRYDDILWTGEIIQRLLDKRQRLQNAESRSESGEDGWTRSSSTCRELSGRRVAVESERRD